VSTPCFITERGQHEQRFNDVDEKKNVVMGGDDGS